MLHQNHTQLKHSTLGVISSILAIAAGFAYVLMILGVGVLLEINQDELNKKTLAVIVIGLFFIGSILMNLSGIGLVIAGLIQKKRRKLFAIIGLVLNAIVLVSLVLFLCVILVCGKQNAVEFDLGTISGSTYENKYFGLTITIPSGWEVQKRETAKMLRRKGRKVLAGDNKKLKATLKNGESTCLNLLTILRYPLGSSVKFNPGFYCTAEKMTFLSGIKTGEDFFLYSKKLIQQTQVRDKYKFKKDIYSELIDGKRFDIMEVERTGGSVLIQQKWYVCIIKKHALFFMLVYSSDEELLALKEIVDSIKFK